MRQLSHEEFEEQNHSLSIRIICDKLQSPANLGIIFRSAEAFGVSTIYVHIDNESYLNQPRFIKAARHAFKHINIEIYSDKYLVVKDLKSMNYHMVSLEKCDHSLRIQDVMFKPKTCIIVGHENNGVDPIFLENSHDTVHIDMYGKNSSMNVSQALSIGLYEYIRQLV